MAKIVFWSPEKSMSGNTHAIIATSTLMSIIHKAKSILMQGYFNSRKIESSFTPYDELKASGVFTNSDIGIGALTKIIVSNKLTSETIKNYTKPVLKDRLDILYGVTTTEEEQYDLVKKNIQFIARKSDEIYDLVFVDLPKGLDDEYIKNVLSDSEVVVCVLNQDIVKLDTFFSDIEKNKLLKDKQVIYVIADADEKSKYNVRNIKMKYRIRESMFLLPHNYLFVEACNDGDVIDYFYKNINSDINDYNGFFISEVSKLVEEIIIKSKIKDY